MSQNAKMAFNFLPDFKRDKFHSNDPLFESTILGFLAKTEKNLHSKMGVKVKLVSAIVRSPAIRAN